jgi:DNA-directed RNA polymerase specialized sigma24 family protein
MTASSQWTPEELQAWLQANLTTTVDRKRWILMSARLLKGLPVPPDALLGEAVARALAGVRKFNRDHPIEANLHEAMRSIASSWHKARKRKPEISFEDLIGSEIDAQDPLEVFLAPHDVQYSPQDELECKQEFDAMLALFADREDGQLVLLGRHGGLKGKDLAEFVGIDQAKLASVQRLVSRRLAEYRRDA